MRWLGLFVMLAASTASAAPSNPAFLGIQMPPGSSGACPVTGVTKDGSAEAAGVRDGDFIVAMDGKQVAGCDALVAMIQARQPGDEVKLVISRSPQSHLTIVARLMSRDEVVRKRFGGLPMPSTALINVEHFQTVDLSKTKPRSTTIVGWYAGACAGCDAVFRSVSRWQRKAKQRMSVVAVTNAFRNQTMKESVETLKSAQKMLDVPLLVADQETYEQFAIGDGDRVQFMVIDCHGIVRYAAPVVPSAEDAEAALDELYAAAEQASHRKSP